MINNRSNLLAKSECVINNSTSKKTEGYLILRRFIIAILQSSSPKCLETKNPTNGGLDIISTVPLKLIRWFKLIHK
jgi:hypothetical protein